MLVCTQVSYFHSPTINSSNTTAQAPQQHINASMWHTNHAEMMEKVHNVAAALYAGVVAFKSWSSCDLTYLSRSTFPGLFILILQQALLQDDTQPRTCADVHTRRNLRSLIRCSRDQRHLSELGGGKSCHSTACCTLLNMAHVNGHEARMEVWNAIEYEPDQDCKVDTETNDRIVATDLDTGATSSI